MAGVSRGGFPSAEELAAYRAWASGMSSRAAIEQFLPERRQAGQSSRALIGEIRRRLLVAAQAKGRTDLAAILAAAAGSRKAREIPVALEALRSARYLIPQAADEVARWLPARLAQPLNAAGLKTLADVLVHRAARKSWCKRVPGIGRIGASSIGLFLDEYPDLVARAAVVVRVQAGDIVAWERLRAPRELDGSHGAFRAPRSSCILAANNDYEAVQAWLTLQDSEATRRAYRKEAERLMLWAILERGKALSSLVTEDAVAYRAFLRNPTPRERWTGPKASRASSQWRPFEGPLSTRSVAYSIQVIGALYRWLIEQRYLLANPFSGVKVKGARRSGPVDIRRAFTEHEWSLIRTAATFTSIESSMSPLAYARLCFLLDFSYTTGLRASELVHATLGDVETDPIGHRWLNIRGKGAKAGRVVLVPAARQALQDYLLQRLLPPNPEQWVPTTMIVGSIDGEGAGIGSSRLWRILKRFFKQAADLLEKTSPATATKARLASPHWMRHTHASHGLAHGVDVAAMRDNLRHSSIAVTSTYLHSEDGRRAKAFSAAFSTTVSNNLTDVRTT